MAPSLHPLSAATASAAEPSSRTLSMHPVSICLRAAQVSSSLVWACSDWESWALQS